MNQICIILGILGLSAAMYSVIRISRYDNECGKRSEMLNYSALRADVEYIRERCDDMNIVIDTMHDSLSEIQTVFEDLEEVVKETQKIVN